MILRARTRRYNIGAVVQFDKFVIYYSETRRGHTVYFRFITIFFFFELIFYVHTRV